MSCARGKCDERREHELTAGSVVNEAKQERKREPGEDIPKLIRVGGIPKVEVEPEHQV